MKRKESELAFLSGCFDVRGCIKIEAPRGSDVYHLYAWITSKSFTLMEFLQTFGARVAQKQDGQYRAKWKDGDAATLLKSMLPFLRVKKEQADTGIEFYEAKKRKPDDPMLVESRLRLKLLKREEGDE